MRIALVVLVVALVGCENSTEVTVKTQVDDVPLDTIVVEDTPEEVEDEVVETPAEDVNETPEDETAEDVVEETSGTTHIIKIEALRVKPEELTIKMGDTVIWKNNDKFEEGGVFHQLVAYKKEFRGPRFFRGEQFQHTFNTPGTFVYTDLIYKERESMRGIIIVEE